MKKLISILIVFAVLLSMTCIAFTVEAAVTEHTSQSKVLVPLHGEKAKQNANQTLTAVGATEISVVDTQSLENPTGADVPEGTAYHVKALNTTAKNGASFDTPDIDFRDIFTGQNTKTNEANWYFEGWLWVSEVSRIGNFVMRIYPKGFNHTILSGASVDYWIYQVSLQNIDIDGTVDGTQKLASGWNHLKIKMSTLSTVLPNYNANNDTANQGYIAAAMRDFLDGDQIVGGFSIHDHTASKANNYTWALAGARIVESDGIGATWGTEEIAGIYVDTTEVQSQFASDETFNTNGLKVYKHLASGDSEEITNYTVSRAGTLDAMGREKVNISYTQDGITYKTYYYLKSAINPLTSNLTGWAAGNSATSVSMDTSDKRVGDASLSVTNTASGTGMVIYAGDMGHELYAKPGDTISFWAKVNDVSKLGAFTFEVSSTHSFFPSTRYIISGTNLTTAFTNGEWKKISFVVPSFDSVIQNDTNGYYNILLGSNVYTGANYQNIKYFRIFWNVGSAASATAPLTMKINNLTVENGAPTVYSENFTAWNSTSLESGWSITAANGYTFDTDTKNNGAASVSVNGNSSAYSLLIYKGKSVLGECIDLTDIDTIEFDIYLENASDLKELYFEIASSPNWFNNVTRYAMLNSSCNNAFSILKSGWNTIRMAVPKSSVTTQALPDGHGMTALVPSNLREADISRIGYMRCYFKSTDNAQVKFNNLRLVKSQPILSNVFTDNAVLQQNKPVSLYGQVNANETVDIEIKKGNTTVISGSATADSTGYWNFVSTDTVKGSFDEYTITAKTAAASITLKNILFGEVWASGGQSNMEFKVSKSTEPEVYEALGRNKYIRMYEQSGGIGHGNSINTDGGEWLVDTDETYMGFSAVAYSFAAGLFEELNVPVGVICTAVGGSSSVCWLDPEDLKVNYPDIYSYIVQSGWVEGMKYVNRSDANDLLSWYTAKTSNDVLGGYYYSRVTPFDGYNTNGIIWYQGCHDVDREPLQAHYMEALQTQWSKIFSTEDTILPLIYFELAPYTTIDKSSNANMRHLSQAHALNAERGYDSIFAVPNYDLWTNLSDIHPSEKHTLALRAADIALGEVYSAKENYSGPEAVTAVSDGTKVTVTFENVGDGLTLSKGDEVAGFGYLVGTVYTEMPATITSANTVEIDITGIKTDTIYYACGNQMLTANLMNSYGYMSIAFGVDITGDAAVNEAESSSDISFSGEWHTKNLKQFSEGSAMYTKNGGVVEISFTGDLFELVSYKSYTQGTLYVSIDGSEETAISLGSDTVDTEFMTTVYSAKLAAGEHTVRIRAEGKAYIDSVKVRGGLTENTNYTEGYLLIEAENNDAIALGGSWSTKYAWKHSAHNALRTKAGGTAEFKYSGYGFKITSYKGSTQGKMFISVDGAEPVEIDLYEDSTDISFNEIVYESGILSNADHRVVITTEGTVYLDAIYIDGDIK